MEKVEVVLKFMKNIVWGLVIEGLVMFVMGILIFIYPDLLGLLVGLALIITGILSFILALKVNKYSQLKFKI